MKKVALPLSLIAVVLGFFLLPVACDLFSAGLGSKVDIEVPTLTIATPSAGSYNRLSATTGDIIFAGTAGDDVAVASVTLSWEDSEGGNEGSKVASLSGSSWTVSLTSGEALADGTYTFTVTARDNGGKAGTNQIVAYIDNTPPTVLATSPLTYGSDQPTFYRTIDLKGEVYDESPLTKVEVYVVDSAGNTIEGPQTADGTNTWSTRFDFSSRDDLNNTSLYFNIVATDKAGNTNTYFYHRFDIYPLLTAVAGYVTFPSMNQLGLLDQTSLAILPEGLTQAELDAIRHGDEPTAPQFYPDFLFLNQDSPKVQWLNIPEATSVIGIGVPIVGSILPPSDGSSIDKPSVSFVITNSMTSETIPQSDVTLTSVGSSLNFELLPETALGTELPTGNYYITVNFETNSSMTGSSVQVFGVSAGAPFLSETAQGGSTNPIVAQKVISSTVTMSGFAQDSGQTMAATLSYSLDGTANVAVTVNADGSYSIPVAAPSDHSNDGSHTWVLTATSGGLSSSLSRSFVIDTRSPVLAISNPSDGLWVDGTSGTLTVNGTAADTWEDSGETLSGSGVSKVYWLVDTSTVDHSSDTDWATVWNVATGTVVWSGSLDISAMAIGEKKLWVRAVDSAGNASLASATFGLDKQNPSLSFDSPVQSYYTVDTFAVTGTASDDNTVASVKVVLNGTMLSTLPLSGSDNAWTSNAIGWADGSYTAAYTVTDIAGKTYTETVSFRVDTTHPAITVNNLSDGDYLSSSSYTIRGIASDDSGLDALAYSLDHGGTWTAITVAGSWSVPVSGLSEGSGQTIRFKATDKAGLTTITSDITFGLDLYSPRGTELSYTSSLIQTAGDVTLTGQADDDAANPSDGTTRLAEYAAITWTKDGAEQTPVVLVDTASSVPGAVNGVWSWTLDSDPNANGDHNADGLYVVTLSVRDVAGKTASVTRTIQIDTTGPTVAISVPAPGESFSVTTCTISGTARDTGGVGFDGTLDAEYNMNSSGWVSLGPLTSTINWSSSGVSIGATEGAKSLSVRATDKVGNITTTSVAFYYDLASPSLTEAAVGTTDTQYAKTDLVFSGQADDSNALASLTVSVNGGASIPITVDSDGPDNTVGTSDDGAWSWTLAAASIAEGSYALSFTATDAAAKTRNLTRTVFVDRSSPAVTVSTDLYSAWNISASKTVAGTASDSSGSGISRVEYRLSPDSGSSWGAWSSVTGTAFFSGSVGFEDGDDNILEVRAVDRAGNASTPAVADHSQQTVRVDTDNPGLEITDPLSTPVSNGSVPLAVTVAVTDSGSGPAMAQAKVGSSDFSSGTVYTAAVVAGSATLSGLDLSALSPGTQRVYLRAIDVAGRASSAISLSVTIDKTPPTVSFTSHANGDTINKTVDFSGNAGDSYGIDSVTVEAWNASLLSWVDAATLSGAASGTTAWSYAGFDTAPVTAAAATWDSDTGTAGLQLKLRARAVDTALNVGTELRTFLVDQGADKPVVKLTNLATTGTPILKSTRVIYGSITDDDGTVAALKMKVAGGDSFTAVTLDGQSFSFSIESSVPDGSLNLYFEITDAKGQVFTTAASASDTTPRLYQGVATYLETPLLFTLDTVNPEIGSTVGIKLDADVVFSDYAAATAYYGGTASGSFSVRFTASDSSGIASASVKILDSNGASVTQPASLDSGWYVTASSLAVTGLESGAATLQITVVDGSGLSSQLSKTISIDNDVPILSLGSSPAAGDLVNGDVTVKGTAEDADTSVKSVWYKVGSDDWVLASGTASWSIPFTTAAGNPIDNYATAAYSTYVAGDETWTFPILLRAYDKAGNWVENSGFYLKIDPSGDKPKVTISYPLFGNSPLGGTVRFYGTATDDDAVAKVFMQIDTNAVDTDLDGDVDDQDTATYDTGDDDYGTAMTDWYNGGLGQEITGANNWNWSINSSGEFNPVTGTKTIHVRVRALDYKSNGATAVYGPWVQTTVIIDKNVPQIGSAQPLVLSRNTTYGDSDDVSYTSGMYISGDWYLMGSVEDESYISDIAVTGTLSTANIVYTNVTAAPLYPGEYSRIDFRIAIDTTAGACYTLSSVITGSDEANHDSTLNLRFEVDNQAPGGTFSGSTPMVQDNGVYKVSGTADDLAGSGISKVEVYFVRFQSGSSTTGRFYLPTSSEADTTVTRGDFGSVPTAVFSNGTAAYPANPAYILTVDYPGTETTDSQDGDGFLEKLKAGSGSLFNWYIDINSLSIPDGPIEIHYVVYDEADNATHYVQSTTVENNGPAMGSLYFGTDLDGDSSVVSGEKTLYATPAAITNTSFKVKVAPMTLDPVVAGGNNNLYYSLSIDGTAVRPLLTQAGSFMIGESYTIVTAGTTDFTAVGATGNTVGETFVATGPGSGSGTVWPTVRKGSAGALYSLTLAPAELKKAIATTAGSFVSGRRYTIVTVGSTDFTAIGAASNTVGLSFTATGSGSGTGTAFDNGRRAFALSLYDATEETVPGTDSLSLVRTVSCMVELIDSTAPVSRISPFAWTSSVNNSLYQENPANGHIEISSAVGGAGPDISGKVQVEGTAFDDQRIASIYLQIDGMTFTGNLGTANFTDENAVSRTYSRVADYGAGTWTYSATADIAGEGWIFSASTLELSQSGHEAAWRLDWDTSRITTVAAQDAVIRVAILDRDGNVSLRTVKTAVTVGAAALVTGTTYQIVSVGTTNFTAVGAGDNEVGTVFTATGSGSGTGTALSLVNTPLYTVDVVPYIKAMSRSASYSTIRSRLGRYVFRRGEAVTATGFNLYYAANTVFSIGGANATLGASTTSSLAATVPATASSGSLTLTVNALSIPNNANSNTPEYNSEATASSATDGSALWTDDRKVHIWVSDSNQATGNYGYFTGSDTPYYPAMTYASGALYASWSNYSAASIYYATNSSGRTQIFQGYDPCEHTDIAYNSFGSRPTVVYNANMYGNNTWNEAGAGGVQIWDANAPNNADGSGTWSLYEMEELYHNQMLMQFINQRIVASSLNDNSYITYFDTSTRALKYSMVRSGDAGTVERGWVNIDGGSDGDDTATRGTVNNGTGATRVFTALVSAGDFVYRGQNIVSYPGPNYVTSTITGNVISINSGSINNGGTIATIGSGVVSSANRSATVGEYSAIALNTQGYPVIAYYDSSAQTVKIAHGSSTSPGSGGWTIQYAMAVSDPNYQYSGKYISIKIDSSGYLHMVFYRNSTGDLVYMKSTNAPTNGTTDYTFGSSEIIDSIGSVGSGADISLYGTVPYVSYYDSSLADSFNGLKLAYLDGGVWEYMNCPLFFNVAQDSTPRTSVECNTAVTRVLNAASTANTFWTAAIGYKSDDYYRVAYYSFGN